MEKKELLFFIVIVVFVYFIFSIVTSFKAEASDIGSQSIISAEDNITHNITHVADEIKESVQVIVEEGRRSALGAIKDKWNELRVMMQGAGTQELQDTMELETGSLNNNDTTLKVFVSTSMNASLLASYGLMAKKYGAVLVLKGLPEGSWSKLSDLIFELNKVEGDNITVQIDDPAFDEYGITRVPSFVLVREENIFEDNKDKVAVFDKITGNIGIRRALEEFVEKGELQSDARAILSKAEGK